MTTIDDLTPEQRAALTGADDMWHATGVPEAGVGRLKMSDGPTGARGAHTAGTRSQSFPCGTALAATWDRDLLGRVGATLAAEAIDKGAHILLGPTVNLHRHPLAGRNFECYSEDPVLTTEMAVAYIDGVQAAGIGACIKHFVANEQETERMTISAEVDERTLREMQLAPFEAAVVRSRVAAVMSAYNKVNGTWCGEHAWLLTTVLRDEWGFDGIVMSDWFGTHTTEAVAAGLDLEMPGPPFHLGAAKLAAAIAEGRVDQAAVDQAAARLLAARARWGVTDAPEPDERSEEVAARRAVATEAAARSIVLLRNDHHLLPLQPDRLERVAVIGPNADRVASVGGGSSHVNAHRVVSPLEGLAARLGDAVEVTYEPGCANGDGTVVLDRRTLSPGPDAPDGQTEGLLIDLSTTDEGDRFLHTLVASEPHVSWIGLPRPELVGRAWKAEATATFRPPVGGRWTFGLQSVGPAALRLDGEVVVDNTVPERGGSFYGFGSTEVTAELDLTAGEVYDLHVEYTGRPDNAVAGFTIKARMPLAADAFERAVDAARRADAVVVVVGTTPEWETEGRDRRSLDLPGRQAELAAAVAEANPSTVVVLNSGSPVTTDWAAPAGALLQLWFPGETGGTALAEVLTGDRDATGRLPVSFPVRLEDAATFEHFPGTDGKVTYAEGSIFGYRHHDTAGVRAAYPFGHGLSYAEFAYGEPALSSNDDGWPCVDVEVTNVSERAGTEVVQVYARTGHRPVPAAAQQLVGFATVALDAGAAATVRVALDSRAWTYWSPDEKTWATDEVEVDLVVGSSSTEHRGSVLLDPSGCPPRRA